MKGSASNSRPTYMLGLICAISVCSASDNGWSSSFLFYFSISGSEYCVDVHSGPVDVPASSQSNLLVNAGQNRFSPKELQSLAVDGEIFNIAFDKPCYQIINETSGEVAVKKLEFTPLTQAYFSGDVSSHGPFLIVLGIDFKAKCSTSNQLQLSYTYFSPDYCTGENGEITNRQWCSSLQSNIKLTVRRNCSDAIFPTFLISQNSVGKPILFFDKGDTQGDLLCYYLGTGGGQECQSGRLNIGQGYRLIAALPSRSSDNGYILQVHTAAEQDLAYKCYNYTPNGGLSRRNECLQGSMILPTIFTHNSDSQDLVYHFNLTTGQPEILSAVNHQIVDFDDGLVYISGEKQITVNRPAILGGVQHVTLPYPVYWDQHQNSYVKVTSTGSKIVILLSRQGQPIPFGIVEIEGRYLPVQQSDNVSGIQGGEIIWPASFIPKGNTLYKEASTNRSSKQLLALIALPAILVLVLLGVGIVTIGILLWRRRLRESHSMRQNGGGSQLLLLPADQTARGEPLHTGGVVLPASNGSATVHSQDLDSEGQDLVQVQPNASSHGNTRLPIPGQDPDADLPTSNNPPGSCTIASQPTPSGGTTQTTLLCVATGSIKPGEDVPLSQGIQDSSGVADYFGNLAVDLTLARTQVTPSRTGGNGEQLDSSQDTVDNDGRVVLGE